MPVTTANSEDFLDFRASAGRGLMRLAVAFSLALHIVLATAAGLYWHKRVAGVSPREPEVTIEFTTEVESPVASAEVAALAPEVAPLPRETPAKLEPAPVPVPEPPPIAESLTRNEAPAEALVEIKSSAVVSVSETRPSVATAPATNAVVVAVTGSLAVKAVGQPKPGGEAKSKPGLLAQPLYRRNPEPPYPLAARRRRQEGVVLLAVDVTAKGRAARVAVQKSSGFKLLDEAAARAVEDWEFEPAREGAAAVDSRIEVPVRFRLAE